MSKLRSPIRWFGGKGRMVKKILPLLPTHQIYVEPFCGGASILFAKPPAPVEVLNDLDGGLINFYRVLRNEEQFAKLRKLANLTLYAREEYDHCRATWSDCEDDVERAYRWYVVARMSFGGRFGAGWGSAVTETVRGMAGTCSKWLSTIEMLPQIHARLQRVQIENSDWRVILNRYDTPETLFYCDPPYIPETRRQGGHAHEMTADDHKQLVHALLGLRGKAILSGYAHPIHKPLEGAGWERKDWQVCCSAAGRTRASGLQGEGSVTKKQARVESVWISPRAQKQRRLFW